MEVFEEDEEDRVSERSYENEDEIRNREIEKKTMANVTNYDDWLEAQTQKEIERQSQAAISQAGPLSPKSNTSMPKKGVMLNEEGFNGRANMN